MEKTLSPAYLALKKFVQNYVIKNFDLLSEKYEITKEDLEDLKNNQNDILEWVLGECLDENEFNELGIVLVCNWEMEDSDTHTTIYKIGKKLIRSNFKHGNENGKYFANYKYDFVKSVKRKVVVYSYEVIG